MLFVIVYRPRTVKKCLRFLWFVAQKAHICTERLKAGEGGREKEKKNKRRKKKAAFQPEIPTPKDLHMV